MSASTQTEPAILKGWEAFSFPGGPTGVLVLQGFTGSTTSVIGWGRGLAAAGYRVEGPRLSGHGTRWQDLIGVRWQDWLADAEAALGRLQSECRTVFVAGLSMGGGLAVRLAELHPELAGVLLVNNAMFVENPLTPLLPILRYLVRSVPAIANDIMDPGQKEIGYDRTPVWGVNELNRMLKVVRSDLGRLQMPFLVFKSRQDHVLSVHNAEWTLANLPMTDKELVWLERSFHVATQDHDLPEIVRRSLEFITRHAGNARP